MIDGYESEKNHSGGVETRMTTMIVVPTILAVIAVLGLLPVTFASSSSTFKGSFSGAFAITTCTQTTITCLATGPYELFRMTMVFVQVTITDASEYVNVNA